MIGSSFCISDFQDNVSYKMDKGKGVFGQSSPQPGVIGESSPQPAQNDDVHVTRPNIVFLCFLQNIYIHIYISYYLLYAGFPLSSY